MKPGNAVYYVNGRYFALSAPPDHHTKPALIYPAFSGPTNATPCWYSSPTISVPMPLLVFFTNKGHYVSFVFGDYLLHRVNRPPTLALNKSGDYVLIIFLAPTELFGFTILMCQTAQFLQRNFSLLESFAFARIE